MNVKRVPMKSAHRFNKNMNSDIFANEKYNSQLSTNPYSKTIPIDHQMKIEDQENGTLRKLRRIAMAQSNTISQRKTNLIYDHSKSSQFLPSTPYKDEFTYSSMEQYSSLPHISQ